MSEQELKEIEEFYSCDLLAWHDKGEQSVVDVPKLIKCIRDLKMKVNDDN